MDKASRFVTAFTEARHGALWAPSLDRSARIRLAALCFAQLKNQPILPFRAAHPTYSDLVELEQRLHRGLAYAALYRRVLSNHLPMALIALHRMGATEGQMDAFEEHYAKRLEPRKESPKPRSLADLERLAEGVGAAAFHGLIRTAYALEAGYEPEIQAALEAWDQSDLPLGRTRQPVLHLTLDVPAATSIHERMRRVAEQEAFRAACTSQGPLMTLDEVRELALRTYWGTRGDFTALHLVTATHAWRIVHQHQAIPIEPFLAAVSCAYLTLPQPMQTGEIPLSDAPWEALLPLATASLDDHTIKFVHTCHEEDLATGDPRYRSLAAQRLGWNPAVSGHPFGGF